MHEYLGFSAGLDFESKIMVKENAPELLRKELASPKWKPQELAMSGVTDCYQPIERKLQLTRGCLAVLAEFRNPVSIITKNALVTRDLDLLRELASFRAVHVNISITTLDAELARKLEPRAASPKGRLAAMETLAKAGIPVGVLVAPAIPAINDHEIPSVLGADFSAMARAQFSRPQRQGAWSHPCHSRGQAQRPAFRLTHARGRNLCRSDLPNIPRRLPESGFAAGRARAVGRGLSSTSGTSVGIRALSTGAFNPRAVVFENALAPGVVPD
jgi:DNA repair photolyase